MKTIPFRFEFHQEKPWRYEVYLEGDSDLSFGSVQFDPPPGPPKAKAHMPIECSRKPKTKMEIEVEMARLEGERVTKAWMQTIAASYPRALGFVAIPQKNRSTPKTFEEFKQESIETMQLRALDSASLLGIIYAPTNYVSEFWTKDHVCRLAKALANPRKKIPLLALKGWLADNWIPLQLFNLTAKELAEKANSALATTHTPEKIWTTAYRLGLYTHRTPGPPARK
jgi:hypothetical protein